MPSSAAGLGWCLLCLLVARGALAQAAAGWRMIDRFYGFRYELSAAASARLPEACAAIQAQADQEGCFGWVQKTSGGTFVGEARCAKDRGLEFEKWVRQFSGGEQQDLHVLVYDDTKIRLHFSHFKILEEERDTCFLDAPHQCPSEDGEEDDGGEEEEEEEGADGTAAASGARGATRGEEL